MTAHRVSPLRIAIATGLVAICLLVLAVLAVMGCAGR